MNMIIVILVTVAAIGCGGSKEEELINTLRLSSTEKMT